MYRRKIRFDDHYKGTFFPEARPWKVAPFKVTININYNTILHFFSLRTQMLDGKTAQTGSKRPKGIFFKIQSQCTSIMVSYNPPFPLAQIPAILGDSPFVILLQT